MEITFKEVEVTKLNLEPGDVLMVTLKTPNPLGRNESVKYFGEAVKERFPDNEVFIAVLDSYSGVEYSVVKVGEKDEDQG
jgi:hypothetical protein